MTNCCLGKMISSCIFANEQHSVTASHIAVCLLNRLVVQNEQHIADSTECFLHKHYSSHKHFATSAVALSAQRCSVQQSGGYWSKTETRRPLLPNKGQEAME